MTTVEINQNLCFHTFLNEVYVSLVYISTFDAQLLIVETICHTFLLYIKSPNTEFDLQF